MSNFHQNKRPNQKRKRIEEPLLPGTSISFQELRVEKYEGVYLTDYCVWIQNKEQGLDLFRSGFYGKGILSKSKPSFSSSSVSSSSFNQKDEHQKKREAGFHRSRVKKNKEEKEIDHSKEGIYLPSTSPSLHSLQSNEKEQEPLQLGLEEAFFLLFALEVLTIYDQHNKEMNVVECWNKFTEASNGFQVNYAAYHHYRTHGWTPKYGLKYGSDWILYQKGPSFYHAEKAIVVLPQIHSNLPFSHSSLSNRNLSWLGLLNMNRVSEQVKKGLTICNVFMPKNSLSIASSKFSLLSSLKFSSLFEGKEVISHHLKQFEILEMNTIRWQPSQTRD